MNDTAVTRPNAFGSAIRHEWALDWTKLTVNHGSYGATPKKVLAAQTEWRARMEAQPSTFMRCILPDALRESAATLGTFLGADGRDIAFVDNATAGCNAVLRSLSFKPDDEIIVLSQGYRAVVNTVRYVAELSGARMVEVELAFPTDEVDSLIERLSAALTTRTRLVVADHITSPSALILPIEEIVRVCHEADVPVMIDGAHGPGHVAIDLTALNADWYVGNCHKWLMAPKGSAFLWARRDRQQMLHPTIISHGYQAGFLQEFDWTGTRDASCFLAIDAAITFHKSLGGPSLCARNADLAWKAAQYLADALGTKIGNPPQGGSMALVRLPVDGPATRERAVALRDRLLREFETDLPLMAHPDGIWLRLSAQAYNQMSDYEALAKICATLVETDRKGERS